MNAELSKQEKCEVTEKTFTGCEQGQISNGFRFKVCLMRGRTSEGTWGAGDSEPPNSPMNLFIILIWRLTGDI